MKVMSTLTGNNCSSASQLTAVPGHPLHLKQKGLPKAAFSKSEALVSISCLLVLTTINTAFLQSAVATVSDTGIPALVLFG